MCGIAGYIGLHLPFEKVIEATLKSMNNRGPDHKGYMIDTIDRKQIILLQSRLSIIDLNPRANQPMTIGNCTLVFNGEIYNYKELRNKIKGEVEFTTDSDTEVLLHYYLLYGESCVKYFEGMWAFAVLDRHKHKVFLSRDRFGEKPLYYYSGDNFFIFGSETKFIKTLISRHIPVNHEHILRYMVNGYKSLYKSKDTFFSGIKYLKANENISVDSSLNLTRKQYWSLSDSTARMSVDEAIAGVRQRLENSIKLRLRSDVPLAFCLSGGIDSSAITAIAAKKFNYNVSTFSIIDSDQRYNEESNINATVNDLGCENHKINLSLHGSLDRLKQLIKYHEAPISTISYFVHSMLSEAIAAKGYKVVCSGTAADEMFTGYFDHYNLHLYEMSNNKNFNHYLSDWTKYIKPKIRNPYLQQGDLYLKNRNCREHIYLNREDFLSYIDEDFKEDFYEYKYSDSMLHNRMQNELFNEVVPVILNEDDLNSMYYSIENRSPFLDKQLVEFAYSIPIEYLIMNGFNKYILREAVKGYVVEEVRWDRHKKGFNASINSFFNFQEKELREAILDDSPIYDIVKKYKIEKLMKQEYLTNSYSKFLFNFINVKLFMEI